jgi:hypothetical protein
MIQILLTVLIVATALGIGIYLTIRSLRDPLRGCKGCDKSCMGCSLEDLKNELNQKSKNQK